MRKEDEIAYKKNRNDSHKYMNSFLQEYFRNLLDVGLNYTKNLWKNINRLCSFKSTNN